MGKAEATLQLLAVVLCLAVTTSWSTPATVCPDEYSFFNGRCYIYQNRLLASTVADVECGRLDPSDQTLRLADPRSVAENNFIWPSCRDNLARWSAPWNVWDTPSTSYSNGDLVIDTTNDYWQNPGLTTTSPKTQPIPKFACSCLPPTTGFESIHWCIDVPNTVLSSTRAGLNPEFTVFPRCTAPTEINGTSCEGTAPSGSSRVLCKAPAVLKDTVSVAGRGACWIGLARASGLDSSQSFRWSTGVPEASTTLSFNLFEPELRARSSVDNQAQFTKFNSRAYSTTSASTPNCVAMWSYRNNGSWTVDWCNNQLPYFCVRDARCSGGYQKISRYTVTSAGAITVPRCQRCASGTYRNSTEDETRCNNCFGGYYGNGTLPLLTGNCTGVCPSGTYCPAGSALPLACPVGTYGPTLANPTSGPGWASIEAGCLICQPGYYCDSLGLTQVSMEANKACQAGTCSVAGAVTSACTGQCPAGFYCPRGSSCPGLPCGGPTVYCPLGSPLPITIPNGFFGLGNNTNQYEAILPCSAGYFCTGGVRFPCPVGYYSDETIPFSQRNQCLPCRSGYYCPPPIDSTTASSTSATQQFCAESNDTFPAQNYCINGIRFRLSDTNDTHMTIPTDVPLNRRENVIPCPDDKVCAHGLANDRVTWIGCPSGSTTISVPELLSVSGTGAIVNATLFNTLIPSQWTIDYHVLNQSFFNPAALADSIIPSCQARKTVNDGIFSVNQTTGEILLKRFAPDPRNASSALQFEICEPLTDIRYSLILQASARQKVGSIQANITCLVTVRVLDRNDQPIFPLAINHRVIAESASENTQAARCSGVELTTGCPDDPNFSPNNDIAATDEDDFNKGNLNYSFVGTLTTAQAKLKINSCTGTISAVGGTQIRFSDPTIPWFNSTFKRLNYTIRVSDDGSSGKFTPLFMDTFVWVYIRNVNDPPVILTPLGTDFWIPESTSSRRYPAPAQVTPNTLNFTDDDPQDTNVMNLVKNDASAFEVVNNVIRTTSTGESLIDFESSKKFYSIDIEVRDNGNPSLAAQMTLSIRVANMNDPPVIENNLVFYIMESAGAGSPVCRDDTGSCIVPNPLHAIKSVDPDNIASDKTTYSLTINPGGRFAINSTSGQVSLVNSNSLDFEDESLSVPTRTGRAYTLQVQASSDGVGVVTQVGLPTFVETSTVNFTVYIVDVNEAPTFSTSNDTAFRIVETWPVGLATNFITILASDPDNSDALLLGLAAPRQTLSFSLCAESSGSADGAAFFSVTTNPTDNSRPRITVRAALDFESAPVCAGGTGRCYTLRICVSDNGSPALSGERIYRFDIIDVNEAPSFAQPSYTVPAREDLAYATSIDLTSPFPLIASDPDIGGNAQLSYAITNGDGTNEFNLLSLGAGNGFKIAKRTNVLLDFETKPLYSLRVTCTDLRVGSSAIGKSCVFDQGVSVGCGEGAFCQNSQCYEICPTYSNATTTISPLQVPRTDIFFCQNLTGVTNLNQVTPSFYETTETTVIVQLSDENDAPFIIDRPDTVPFPNVLTNAACNVSGVLSLGIITNKNQVPFAVLNVWDDDKPNPGARAGPFTFLTTGTGTFWSTFQLSNNATGRIIFPICTVDCGSYFTGQVFSGMIMVQDRTELSSTCSLTVTMLDQNSPPDLGPDFNVTSIAEDAVEGTIVFPGYNLTMLGIIDPDTLRPSNPDNLTFSSTFSEFFDVTAENATTSLKQSLNYEALYPSFVATLLIRVVDSRGADDVVDITIPVNDVNEAPFFTVPRLDYTIDENSPGLTALANLTSLIQDPDIYSTNPLWRQMSISISPSSGCDVSCPFEMSGSVLRVKSNATLNFETMPNSWSFLFRVTDGGGLFSEMPGTVTLLNVNEPPVFTGTSSASVDEGSGGPLGKDLINMALFVQDPDASDSVSTLTYNITGGNIGNVFEVSASGFLRIAPNSFIDYESLQQYSISMVVRDSGGLNGTGTFTINVNNLNDVTITSVYVLSGPFAASNALACDGATSTVRVVGTNLGMFNNTPPASISLRFRRSVTLGSAAPVISSSSCSVTVANEIVDCIVSGGGAGDSLLWDVIVSVPTTQILADSVTGFASTVSFPAPEITGMTGTTSMTTAGGQTVTFTGTCLGTPTDAITFGALETDSYVQVCTHFDSVCRSMSTGCVVSNLQGTLITCTNSTLPGLGSQTSFSVRRGRQSSNSFLSGGYGIPVVNKISLTVLRTTGVVQAPGLILNGTNFGGLGTSPSSSVMLFDASGTMVQYNMLGCTVTIAYRQITCSAVAPGVGVNMSIAITFGDQTNEGSPLISFEPPTVISVATDGNALSPSNGGLLVTLTGTSFGPTCGVPGISVASGAANCPLVSASYTRGSRNALNNTIVYRPTICATLSQTQMVCTMVDGTGRDHHWSLTVGNQIAFVSSTAGTTGYSSPVVGAYTGPGALDALTSGSQYVDLKGNHFGPVDGAPVSAQYGNELNPTEFTAVNCTVIEAHFTIRCYTGIGAGDSLAWKVTVDDQVSRAQLSSYGPPSVNAVLISGQPANSLSDDGGQIVTLTGSNFGPPGSTAYLESVTYGPSSFQRLYTVTSRCSVLAHEVIQCSTLPGLGQNLNWRVVVRGQVSDSPSAISSFALPTITSMDTNTSRTNGGSIITISGANFGFCDRNVQVRVLFGTTLVDLRNVMRPSSVDAINFPAECNPGLPAAYGSTRLLSYVVPEMTGSDTIQVRVQVDSVVFPGGSYITPQFISFKYGQPVITDVFAEPGTTVGSILVTLSGINFCRSEACCQTYLDGQIYSSGVTVHSHDRITFLTSGPGSAFVRCPGGDTPNQEFSSQNPYIYGVVRVSDFARIDGITFQTSGVEDVYIFSMFATTTSVVTIGGNPALIGFVDTFPCDTTTAGFRPDTISGILNILVPGQVCARIRATVPPGQGTRNEVVVIVGALRSRVDDVRFEYLAYTAPTITSTSSSFALAYPTTGDNSSTLTVGGTNLGVSGQIMFGLTSTYGTRIEIACSPGSPGYSWSHTQASCRVPPGEGSSLDIRIRVGGQLSPLATTGRLKYQPPTITSFQVENTTDNLADTIGGQILTITGSNFGRFYNASAIATSPGQLPSVLVGPTLACTIVTSFHTQIQCRIPPNEGRNLAVRVTIAGEAPSAVSTQLFSYGPPVVYYFSPSVGQTNGLDAQGNRQVFQIVGKNFGLDQLRVEFGTSVGPIVLGIRSGRDDRDDFLYPGTNHTSIRVYLPSYFGANLNVTVTVNGQKSSPLGPKFSYAAPIISGVNVTTVRRDLATEDIFIDNRIWTTNNQFGTCRAVRPNTPGLAVTMAFKTSIEISLGGAYTRRFRFFTAPDFTTITDATCTESSSRFLGESVQNGNFTDLGEHPTIPCMRAYRDAVSTFSGITIPDQLFPLGGIGYYVVGERQDLYLSIPSYDTVENAFSNPDNVDFALDDDRTATLAVPIPQVLQLVPTSGCDLERWESDSAYRARVESELSNTGTVIPPRKCLFPYLLSVTGSNFGSGTLAPPGALRVFLLDDRGNAFEASTTSSPGNHEIICTTDMGCVHEDNLIVFQVPFGSGRGLRVQVILDNQNNISEPLVDYFGPTTSDLLPGTLNAGAPFMTSSGVETVRVLGTNLGYITSPLTVLFNGKPCENTTWVTGFAERTGRASISCIAPNDVPGIKSVFLCVGGQGAMARPLTPVDDIAALHYGGQRGAWNTTGAPNSTFANNIQAIATSRCPNDFYGRFGEVCLPCPVGGRCYPGYDLPVPQETFSLISMSVTSKRALEGACAKERLDVSLLRTFPDAVFYDTCTQMVRCVPPSACMDRGVCSEGYEYQLYRCRAKRQSNDTDNTCRVFFDAAVGSFRGVDSDCQRNTQPGNTCSFEHPEDCSTCQVTFDGPNAESARGVCTCTQPQRCALCTATTHYRLNNECVKCPDNPALIFSLFIMAGVGCIGLAYYLQKRKINLAFISIGVDYFQVLAVLSTTSVPWPPFIRTIFTIFSLFLASIDITAPECLVPNLEFPTKFYLTELLPLLALMILLSIHIGYTVYKVYKLGKQAKWLSHVSRLIGIYVLILYVLYLSLTKKALDVFNCNPLDPDDGYSYTAFSSLTCDGGGLCRCFEPGGLQDSLIAPAIIFLGIYTFGFPCAVAFVVFKHREEIREDQYLRANQLGDRRETNPRAYMTRKRFQLMYMHFKPKYSFWMLAILGRKFGVAFASLMFRGNPSFQLAVILVVLFISFTLQVSLRPYMSPGEFPVVVKELNENSKRADEDPEQYAIYRDLYRKVNESMRTQAELVRKEKMVRHKMGAGFWEESKQAAREHDRRSVAEKYFFDLNAVEAVLLGATIIIALSGIMFESGRFATTRSDIAWQGNLVVFLVFIVLFGSLFYYMLVFINELWPVAFARYCGRCFLRYQNDGITNEELDKMKDNDIVLDANPLFAAAGPVGDKSKSLQKEIEASKEALALAKRQNEELKRLKSELENGSGGMTARNPLAIRELMSASNSS